MNLTYDIENVDSLLIFHLKGKITSDIDFQTLEALLNEKISANHCRVVFDLNELTHINSSGIGFFMRVLTKTRIMGGDLLLLNVKGNVEKVFQISKLNEIYTICENQMECINYFNKQQ